MILVCCYEMISIHTCDKCKDSKKCLIIIILKRSSYSSVQTCSKSCAYAKMYCCRFPSTRFIIREGGLRMNSERCLAGGSQILENFAKRRGRQSSATHTQSSKSCSQRCLTVLFCTLLTENIEWNLLMEKTQTTLS